MLEMLKAQEAHPLWHACVFFKDMHMQIEQRGKGMKVQKAEWRLNAPPLFCNFFIISTQPGVSCWYSLE